MRILTALVLFMGLSAWAPAQLAGMYTINPILPASATNFVSLLAAVQALNTSGVSGPVTFDIFDDAGPYNETHPFVTASGQYVPSNAVLTMQTWIGSSAANRVTFRAGPGESPVFDATGRGMGVFWGGADYVTLEGIEIRNAPFDGVSLYSEASHTQAFSPVIRRCNIHDCGGAGVCIYGNSSRPQNTLIENNFFWRLQLTNAGAFNTTARFGYVSGRRHDFSRLINNTFHVSTGAGGSFCVIGDLPSGGTGSHFTEVSNNIVVKTVSPTRPVYSFPDNPALTSGIPAILNANCYLDLTGTSFSTGSVMSVNFAAWQAASGRDALSLSADPLLVNPAVGDLHLSGGSPCINMSALPSGVTNDIDGDPRTGVPDVGADEASCSPTQYQTNSTASYLDINGVQGFSCAPAVTVMSQATTGTANFWSSNIGFGWETIIAVAPSIPLSAGALQTGTAQLLNINVAAPVLVFVNGGALPNFSNPFLGNFAVSFTTPSIAIILSMQMANIDPTNLDGFVLSQACQLTVL